jgi:broad specificity phosphatase PhoE
MSSSTEATLPVRHPVKHPRGGRTSLHLVRHGRTLGNVQRILCGSTDVPLDELGLEQARLVGERLSVLTETDVLLTSPLDRARTTAGFIAERLGLTPVARANLAEWNFGDAEGFTFDRLAEIYPEITARFADTEDNDAGYPNGETRREFHDRVYQEFLDILHDYHDHRLIVVAHGGVIGSLLAQVQGRSPNDWLAYNIQNCSVSHLEVTVDDTAIHLINDVQHLDGLIVALEDNGE